MHEDDNDHKPHIRPEDIEGLLPHANTETTQELEDVIELLQRSGVSIESEATLLVLLQNILKRISRETGEELDIHNLSAEQEQKLQEALEHIAHQLQQAGALEHNESLKKLVRILVQSRHKKKDKNREAGEEEEKENDYESLSPKEKERLKKLFKLFVMYEIYKVTNPNQLAGETRLDNFINNLHTRGKDFATKKAGSDMGIEPKQLDEMEKNRKSYTQAIKDFNAGKDTGWSR